MNKFKKNITMYKISIGLMIFLFYPLCWGLEGITYQKGIYKAPLSAFKGDDNPIKLRGGNPIYSLNIPIPKRLKIKKAELDISYENSTSLKEKSQINITFDERSIAQLPLSATSPFRRKKITIPLRNLEAGFYDLSFQGAQQSASSCESGTSAKLWSDIHTDESSFSLYGQLRELNPVLSDLPDLFDKRLWEYHKVTIAAPSSLNQQTLFESGSLTAQGIGLLLEYAPVGIKKVTLETLSGKKKERQSRTSGLAGIDFSEIPSGDVVVLGTRNTLTPFLRQDELNRIDDGYYAIFPRPDDKTRLVLLIAGDTENNLRKAAKAFAHGQLLFPYSSRAILSNLNLPPINTVQTKGTLLPNQGKKQHFTEFGFHSTTLTGMGAPSAKIIFWAHPDPFAPLKDTIDLELNISYSGGMNPDSLLNITLNDRYETGLSLSSENGGRYQNTKLSIPYAHLKPGWNSIKLIADVKPVFMGGDCQPIIDSHLNVTIFENSTIRLNTRSEISALPDLDLLQRTGKPLVNSLNGEELKIVLANASPGTLSASWTLLGKIAQLNNYALTSAEYSLNPNDALLEDNKTTLLIGIDTALPSAVTEHSQFPSLHGSEQSKLMKQEPILQVTVANGFTGLLPESWQNWLGFTQQQRLQKFYSSSSIKADFQRESALLLMRSPSQKNKNLIVVTSADSEKLAEDINALVQFEPWSKISGDTVLWSADSKYPGLVRSARISKSVDEDSIGIQRSIGYYFTEHPWLFLLCIITIFCLVVFTTHKLLIKRHLKREVLPQD